MRSGIVYYNTIEAGTICELKPGDYIFTYSKDYLLNQGLPAISVTLPKSVAAHASKNLHPFFYSLLSEGANKKTQCRQFKIDADDDFGLLLKTGAHETIGAITIQANHEN